MSALTTRKAVKPTASSLGKLPLAFLLLLLSMGQASYAACNPHDHNCMYHGAVGATTLGGIQHVEYTKGAEQATPSIPNTNTGLYLYGEWANNSSGKKPDLDVDALLPANTPGVNVITRGGFPASTDPFTGIAGEHTRHVNTDQYQITFDNNTATAVHSADANGLAQIPKGVPCTPDLNKSCEFVQVKGNVPTGTYGAALTNYDVHRLSDPSTPEYTVSAFLNKGERGKPGYIQGNIVAKDPSGLNTVVKGSMTNRGETSDTLLVNFVNSGHDDHLTGVVLDGYEKNYSSNPIYGNRYTKQVGNTVYTLQDTYRNHWGVKYQDTIQANGSRSTQDLGRTWTKNNVYAGTNVVGKRDIPPPPPPQPIQTNHTNTQLASVMGSGGTGNSGFSFAKNASLPHPGWGNPLDGFVSNGTQTKKVSNPVAVEEYQPTVEDAIVNKLYQGCYATGNTSWSCSKAQTYASLAAIVTPTFANNLKETSIGAVKTAVKTPIETLNEAFGVPSAGGDLEPTDNSYTLSDDLQNFTDKSPYLNSTNHQQKLGGYVTDTTLVIGGVAELALIAKNGLKVLTNNLKSTPSIELGGSTIENGITTTPKKVSGLDDASNFVTNSEASNVVNSVKLKKQFLKQGEFPGITTRQQFANYLEDILNNLSGTYHTKDGRIYYIQESSHTVIIQNPNSGESTVFRPDEWDELMQTVPKRSTPY